MEASRITALSHTGRRTRGPAGHHLLDQHHDAEGRHQLEQVGDEGGHGHFDQFAAVLLQVGAIPGPAEALLLGVALALQQQQLHLIALVGDQLGERHLQGTHLGFEHAGGAVGVDAIDQAEAAVLLHHRRHGNPRQAIEGDAAEQHLEAEAIEDLAEVYQVELILPLQHRIDLVEHRVAVEG